MKYSKLIPWVIFPALSLSLLLSVLVARNYLSQKEPNKILSVKQQIQDPVILLVNAVDGSHGSAVIVYRGPEENGLYTYIAVTVDHVLEVAMPEVIVTIDIESELLLQQFNEPESLFVRFYEGNLSFGKEIVAKSINRFPEKDLAIIGFETDVFVEPAKYASPNQIKNLDFLQEVYAVGFPMQQMFITKGNIVEQLSDGEQTVIATNANIMQGFSGGGLFAKKGDEFLLIGVAQKYMVNMYNDDPLYWVSGFGSILNLEIFNHE
jgi:S1-C subfamily serine protease